MKSKSKTHLILMLIKWGALVVDGRGKLGGHVASQNRGGSYLRTKVTPSNPQTTYQSGVRQLFGAISGAWSGLSASAILAWNNAVDEWKSTNIFGDLKNPSGKALYQRLNQGAQLVGYGPIPLPPLKADLPTGVITNIAINITAGTIVTTGANTDPGSISMFFGTPAVSKGTTFVKNRLRWFFHDDSDGVTPSDVYDAYEARFGTPVLGQRIFLGVKYVMPNGQQSPLQTVLAEVNA